jgi:hypothetical protein
MGAPVTIATFDQHLWTIAERVGLVPYPADLIALLETWKKL